MGNNNVGYIAGYPHGCAGYPGYACGCTKVQAGGGGGGNIARYTNTYAITGGAGGGARGGYPNPPSCGSPASPANNTTYNAVPVSGSYPVVVPANGQVVISWAAQ
jgi:hypothetical protein